MLPVLSEHPQVPGGGGGGIDLERRNSNNVLTLGALGTERVEAPGGGRMPCCELGREAVSGLLGV
jgi:hypothetical protein